MIAEIDTGEAFEAGTYTVILLAKDDGGAAVLIAGGVDSLLGENHEGKGAVDGIKGILDAFDEILFLVDEGGYQLSGVDFAVAHFKEMCFCLDYFRDELLSIVYLADGSDGIGAVMRTDENRLSLIVGDAADTEVAFKTVKILLEL